MRAQISEPKHVVRHALPHGLAADSRERSLRLRSSCGSREPACCIRLLSWREIARLLRCGVEACLPALTPRPPLLPWRRFKPTIGSTG